VPRKAGMERKDLLGINGKIFIGQGQAIARNAAADVRVLVVGNPCNTNCLIAMNNAKAVPADRWFAMTMLDQNRAKTQLAKKAGVDITAVTNLAIWGNHSSTMYPDFYNADRRQARARGHRDEAWFKDTFHPTVQQRGAAIIKARGASARPPPPPTPSSTPCAPHHPHPAGDCFSVAVCSDGSYGIEKGLIFSFPIRSDADEEQQAHHDDDRGQRQRQEMNHDNRTDQGQQDNQESFHAPRTPLRAESCRERRPRR
jgi:malate dehydrogenase